MSLAVEQVNPHACRTWFLTHASSRRAALVDPVLDHLDDYRTLLEQGPWTLATVVDTHTHADHISAASALRDITDADYVMHETAPARCVSVRVRDGDTFDLFGTPVTVLHTPGHTADSTCWVLPDRVFTGDTLFLDGGGAGRDDLPGGDPGAHWESLRRLGALPDALLVCPAHEYHGREPSSLGNQKKTNPHLSPRTKEEFVRYLEDLRLGPADWMKDVLKANYACARDPGAAWIPVDLPACEVRGTLAAGVNDQVVQALSVEALAERLRSAEPPLLLDVREATELTGALGHLPGVVHVPIGDLARRLGDLEPERGRAVVTVCRSGARATTAAQILAQAGFPDVKVLEGGMIAWRKAGLQPT